MWLLALLWLFAAPCDAAIIDIGGDHQARSYDTFVRSAPLARLVQYSVLTGADVSNAVDDAVSCGARVISMSIITGDDPAVHAAIRRHPSIIFVAAAGNGDDRVWYPANYPEVLSVNASDGPANPAQLSAPGSVSSIATPKVAAASFNMLVVNPDLTPVQVTNILTSTAVNGVLDAPAAIAKAKKVYTVFIP